MQMHESTKNVDFPQADELLEASSPLKNAPVKPVGLVRRMAAISSMVAATAGLYGCDDPRTNTTNNTTETPQATSASVIASTQPASISSASHVEIKEQSKYTAPTVEFTGISFDFPLPEELKGTDEKLEKAGKDLVADTQKVIDKKMRNEFAKAKDVEDKIKILRSFVTDVVNLAKKQPAFAAYFKAHPVPTDTKDVPKYAEVLKPLFLKAGYYFRVQLHAVSDKGSGTIKASPELKFYEIEKKEMVSVVDKDRTVKVNTVTLGGKWFDNNSDPASGEFLPDIGVAAYIRPSSEGNANKRIAEIGDAGFIKPTVDVDKLRQAYRIDTIDHEAIHVFVGDKFPKYGKETGMDSFLIVPLQVEVAQGKVAHLQGAYHPMNFQELCAVGAELANSHSKVPISYYVYLNAGSGEGAASAYRLVNTILPIYTLNQAKDSPMKERITQALLNNQPLNTKDFVRLVDESFTEEDVHAVGARLYQLGADLFRDAENGVFQKAQIQRQ